MSLDILSPKSLERQIKVLEEKIRELNAEVAVLERKREACHILLGVPVAPLAAEAEVVVAPKKSGKRKAPVEEVVADDSFAREGDEPLEGNA